MTAGLTPREPGRPGRPRRYDGDEERSLLLDAAFEVIRAKGYSEVTVADILGEAGLSTRSFYRHFESKEHLLHALFRRDAERMASVARARVEVAPTPRTAVEVWIDEILRFGDDRGRAKRAAVLGAAAVAGGLPAKELRRALRQLAAPLEWAIANGIEDGSFPLARTGDAALISSMTWDASTRIAEVPSNAERARVREDVLSFVHRALGVPD